MARKKILVVDDNVDFLTQLTIRLKTYNYDVVTARDAISAVSQARNQKPDLILLDIALPAGDGYVIMERLQKIESLGLIPIIVISALNPEQHWERSLKAGARAYFQKPVGKEELLSAVREALGETAEDGKA